MTEKDVFANKVVDHMMQHDLFSQWLGIEVLEIKEGYSKIQMTVRNEMINGFGIVHGGICFSLADSAFAFACNNRNNLSVALDTSINFTKAVNVEIVLQLKQRKYTMAGVPAFIISVFLIRETSLLRILKALVSEPAKH